MIINIIIMVIRFLFNILGDRFIPKCIRPGGNDNMQCHCKQYYTNEISRMVIIVQWGLVYIAECMCMFVNVCMHDF